VNESLSVSHRRSLYFVEDLKNGDLVTKENVRAIRPGLGLPIKFQNFILGKKVTKEIKRGTPVSWDIFG
jgi:N-acetylneuraminate synthase